MKHGLCDIGLFQEWVSNITTIKIIYLDLFTFRNLGKEFLLYDFLYRRSPFWGLILLVKLEAPRCCRWFYKMKKKK